MPAYTPAEIERTSLLNLGISTAISLNLYVHICLSSYIYICLYI